MEIEILGTSYQISQRKVCEDDLLEEVQGYCDSTTKSIVVCKLKPERYNRL